MHKIKLFISVVIKIVTIIFINRRSGITSHTSHGHMAGKRSMTLVRSVLLLKANGTCQKPRTVHPTVEAEASLEASPIKAYNGHIHHGYHVLNNNI